MTGSGGGGSVIVILSSALGLERGLDPRETNQMAPTMSATTSITKGSGLASLRLSFLGVLTVDIVTW